MAGSVASLMFIRAASERRDNMRCNRCYRPMRGSTAYDGACECGGLIEALPLAKAHLARARTEKQRKRALEEIAACQQKKSGRARTGRSADRSEYRGALSTGSLSQLLALGRNLP